MHKSRLLTGMVGMLAFAVSTVAFVLVRPVLAQEEASSTDSIDQVAAIDTTVTTTTADAISVATDTATVTEDSATVSTPPPPPPLDMASDFEADASTTVSADVRTPSPVEAPPEGFTEVHIIGIKYIDYFTDGTTTYSFPGDPAIDAHLTEKDAPIPTHEGLTWVHTAGQPLYDTSSGDLEESEYAAQPDGHYISKYPPFVSSTSTPDTIVATSTESTTTQQDTSSTDISTSSSSTSDTSVTSDSTSSSAPSDTASSSAEGTSTTEESATSTDSSQPAPDNATIDEVPAIALPSESTTTDETASSSPSDTPEAQ
jgi:hypothetical protein